MSTVLLVRHGRTTANASGLLAGRSPGVSLDARGREQAVAAGERLHGVPLSVVVTSPLTRCRETARALIGARGEAATPDLVVDRGLAECDYGEWTGRPLKELAKEPLWKVVQANPSAAAFPGGESMRTMQARAVDAVRRHDARLGAGDVWVAVSHGDLIKAILADALGLHLDLFQRLHVDPASISIVRYDASGPRVLAQNTHAGDLSWLAPRKGRASRPRGPQVGGGAGPG